MYDRDVPAIASSIRGTKTIDDACMMSRRSSHDVQAAHSGPMAQLDVSISNSASDEADAAEEASSKDIPPTSPCQHTSADQDKPAHSTRQPLHEEAPGAAQILKPCLVYAQVSSPITTPTAASTPRTAQHSAGTLPPIPATPTSETGECHRQPHYVTETGPSGSFGAQKPSHARLSSDTSSTFGSCTCVSE